MEEDERNPREAESLRNGEEAPPSVKTPVCDARFLMTATPAPPLTSNVTIVKAAPTAKTNPCAASVYHDSRLSEGYIRLLRLMPHRDEHAPIQAQLFDYLLLDSGKGTHLYEALSYVWGSEEKPQSVYTDKGCIPITTNLHMALRCLRDCSLDRIIWVDAICINQDDTHERNSQVQSMAKIYARASRVIVWLEETTASGGQVHGEATTDGGRALKVLCKAANGQPTKSSNNETDKQAILTLLQRSWFQRIWVRQQTIYIIKSH